MVINAIISMSAIGGLTFLGWGILNHGIDGTLMMLIIGAISGIAGYNVRGIISVIKGKGGQNGNTGK